MTLSSIYLLAMMPFSPSAIGAVRVGLYCNWVARPVVWWQHFGGMHSFFKKYVYVIWYFSL